MKTMYNIFHNGDKINRRLLTKQDLDRIFKELKIYKNRIDRGPVIEIPVSELLVKECMTF